MEMEKGSSAKRKAKKLLVAIDESECSIKALRYALDTVVHAGDQVILLNSQPTPITYAPPTEFGYVTPELMSASRKIQEDFSKEVLEKAKKICEQLEVKPQLISCMGDPRDSICETVDKIHADLLVMGSRGFGAIKRVFLGSVSDYCVHNVKCPVLIVRNHE